MSKFYGLLVAIILLTPVVGKSERAIPDNNLSYPVFVALADSQGSQGSGFFLEKDNNIYLVTAAHVLFDVKTGSLKAGKAKLLSYSSNPKETGRNIYDLNLAALLAAKRIRRHSTEDAATINFATVVGNANTGLEIITTVTGATLLEKVPSGILCVGLDGIKRFNEVLTANTIYVFGYPTSLGMKDIPQIDPLRPLLRFGIIAGTNPTRKTIILDCPLYPGNSGGPILEVEQDNQGNQHFKVIGIVIQFVPFIETWVNTKHGIENQTTSNSSYAIAISMDPVLELISTP